MYQKKPSHKRYQITPPNCVKTPLVGFLIHFRGFPQGGLWYILGGVLVLFRVFFWSNLEVLCTIWGILLYHLVFLVQLGGNHGTIRGFFQYTFGGFQVQFVGFSKHIFGEVFASW